MQLEPIIPRGKPHMQKSAAKKRSKQRLQRTLIKKDTVEVAEIVATRVQIGSTIKMRYGTEVQNYVLVDGASVGHGIQLLPLESVLGREVIGKRVGDSINVKSAYGRFQFVISQID
jgi:transcription elongation GreA/GreB family factor